MDRWPVGDEQAKLAWLHSQGELFVGPAVLTRVEWACCTAVGRGQACVRRVGRGVRKRGVSGTDRGLDGVPWEARPRLLCASANKSGALKQKKEHMHCTVSFRAGGSSGARECGPNASRGHDRARFNLRGCAALANDRWWRLNRTRGPLAHFFVPPRQAPLRRGVAGRSSLHLCTAVKALVKRLGSLALPPSAQKKTGISCTCHRTE